MKRWSAVFAVLLLAAPLAAPAATALLTADDYQLQLDAWAGSRRLVVLWSVDCPPCQQELAMLGRLRAEDPQLPLTLICADTDLPLNEIETILADHGLAAAESLRFADPVPARLRRAIDPDWYGELPRSYLIEADGRRLAHSGLLPEAPLRAWLRPR